MKIRANLVLNRKDISFLEADKRVLYMIWPEFENPEGQLILKNNYQIPKSGTARMWIINNEMRPFHYDKIKVGTKGHFRQGGTFTADCEVIKILDLNINPTKNE